MKERHYDYIIIGSGAGGCAAAHRLAGTGRRLLILEKGGAVSGAGSTNADRAAIRTEFKNPSPFFHRGRLSRNDEYLNLGGKTKWYGATLMRLTSEEFDEDESHQCPAWPFTAADLAPFYDRAEKLLNVRAFEPEPGLRRILEKLLKNDSRWRLESQPLGLTPDILERRAEVRSFDGFACAPGIKSDGESPLLSSIRALPNVEIITGCGDTNLVGDAANPTKIIGVACAGGTVFTADKILLGAGAMNSPALLQSYIARHGCEDSIPSAALIGRNYKCHLGSLVLALAPEVQTDQLRKTISLHHSKFPHSLVQSSAYVDGELLAARMPAWVPRWIPDLVGRHAYAFLLMTEEGSHLDNRVTVSGDGRSLDYDHDRVLPALREHRRLRAFLSASLLRRGLLPIVKRIAPYSTAHACGTLIAGRDPQKSVVDSEGKVRGLENLYVVDGSVMPRIGRGNPSLTIFAWALYVAETLANL